MGEGWTREASKTNLREGRGGGGGWVLEGGRARAQAQWVLGGKEGWGVEELGFRPGAGWSGGGGIG